MGYNLSVLAQGATWSSFFVLRGGCSDKACGIGVQGQCFFCAEEA